MRLKSSFVLTIFMLSIYPLAIARADVPTNMNVQGQLTDSAGTPVPLGLKIFTFKIFDAATVGTEIWPGGVGEDQTLTTDESGLWEATVGSTIPLPPSVFSSDTSRWLEITVDDGVNPPQTMPRIKLNSSPYAYRAHSSQNADSLGGVAAASYSQSGHSHIPTDISPQGPGSGLNADQLDDRQASYFLDVGNMTSGTLSTSRYSAYADLTAEGHLDNDKVTDLLTQSQSDDRFVNITGDSMTGTLIAPHYQAGDAGVDGAFDLYQLGKTKPVVSGGTLGPYGGYWSVNDSAGNSVARMEVDGPNGGGYFSVSAATSGSFVSIDGNNPEGQVTMRIYGDSSRTRFTTSVTGDDAVRLPADAVSAAETLDEPGLAVNVASTGVTLDTIAMTDLTVVSITIPTAGYVHLVGQCYVRLGGTTGSNGCYLQIDTTSGGGTQSPYFTRMDQPEFASTSNYRYPVSVERTYSLPAGAHTFRLEGLKLTGSNGSAIVYNRSLTAMFYPTSYGSVAAMVTGAEASEFEHVENVPLAAEERDELNAADNLYRVDLRELELKVRQAEAAVEQAQRELDEAQEAARLQRVESEIRMPR